MNSSLNQTEFIKIRIAKFLGYFGLVPFVISSSLIWSREYQEFAYASLSIYTAIILTFIGAVHWGVTISSRAKNNCSIKLIFSVIPALISWIALLISPSYLLPLLATCYFFVWWSERIVMKDLMPDWYVALRNRLSFFVIVLVLFGWTGLFGVGS